MVYNGGGLLKRGETMGRKFEVRKHSMMKTGLQKTKLYSRFGKEIYVCARNRGVNPEANMALKRLIERAKKEQVPMDVINRNIDKAAGAGGENYTDERYEGFGPSGSAFIIDTLTDNVNRTVSEVRACFTKVGSKMGVSGSVTHMFEHLSLIHVTDVDDEAVLEHLLKTDLNVIDIEADDDGVHITADGFSLDKVESALESLKGAVIENAEAGWYPHEKVVLDEDARMLFDKFMTMINDVDDVQKIYHNVVE